MYGYGSYPYDGLPESCYQNWLKRGCSKSNYHLSFIPIRDKKNNYYPRKYFVKFVINKLCKENGLGNYLISKHIMDYYDITSLTSPISEDKLFLQKCKNIKNYWITKHSITISIKQIIIQQWNNFNNQPLPWYNENRHPIYYITFGDLKWFHYDCIVRKKWFVYDFYKKKNVLEKLLKDNQIYSIINFDCKQSMIKALMLI